MKTLIINKQTFELMSISGDYAILKSFLYGSTFAYKCNGCNQFAKQFPNHIF